MISEWREPLVWWWQMYAKNLSEYLIENHNCNVDLFTRSFIWEEGKSYKQNEILKNWKWNIFRVWPTTSFFNIFWRLLRLLNITFFIYKKSKKEKYDIIHAHALSPGLPAYIIWKILKIPVVYTVHGTMQMDANRKWLMYYGEKFFVTQISYDLEISVSHNVLKYPNKNKNIVIIHPWINIQRFEDVKNTKKYPGVNFLFVWRLDWQKWLEYLLEWISLIDKNLLKEKWFHLNIVGNWNLKLKLEELIMQYGINEFISMKWEMRWEPLVNEYKSNQIFILPSLAEWQPVVIFEAFLSKLPVIATDVWDNKYFIKDLENWFLIPTWNANAIKETIEKILDMDKWKYDRIGETNYDIAKNYSRDNISSQIYKQYQILLDK